MLPVYVLHVGPFVPRALSGIPNGLAHNSGRRNRQWQIALEIRAEHYVICMTIPFKCVQLCKSTARKLSIINRLMNDYFGLYKVCGFYKICILVTGYFFIAHIFTFSSLYPISEAQNAYNTCLIITR